MNTSKLQQIAAAMRGLPRTLAIDAAKKVAPDLTEKATTAFDAGVTVYGDARPDGKTGPVTLHKTGALEAGLKFTSVGTRVRAVLTVPYAKFNVRFGILPRGGSVMPTAWSESIDGIITAAIKSALP